MYSTHQYSGQVIFLWCSSEIIIYKMLVHIRMEQSKYISWKYRSSTIIQTLIILWRSAGLLHHGWGCMAPPYWWKGVLIEFAPGSQVFYQGEMPGHVPWCYPGSALAMTQHLRLGVHTLGQGAGLCGFEIPSIAGTPPTLSGTNQLCSRQWREANVLKPFGYWLRLATSFKTTHYNEHMYQPLAC